MPIDIERATDLSARDLAPLIAESESEGWRFLRRLIDDWTSGANRFDRPGEVFFVARVAGLIVGVCGLNVDPYAADELTGRVRRLYVLRDYRGNGIGRRLVEAVVAAAMGRFRSLRVRTENPDAARFYECLGFANITGDLECTHVLELSSKSFEVW